MHIVLANRFKKMQKRFGSELDVIITKRLRHMLTAGVIIRHESARIRCLETIRPLINDMVEINRKFEKFYKHQKGVNFIQRKSRCFL